MARPGVEGGAESVPIHQADLGVDGLVPEQVLLRRDHVLQNLFVRTHDFRDGLPLDLRQDLE